MNNQKKENRNSNSISLAKDTDHISFVEGLIKTSHDDERINYTTYLKALKDGLLENHKGRYVFIRKGKMLNKSFKRAHDIFDHFPPESCSFPSSSATFIYVPLNKY